MCFKKMLYLFLGSIGVIICAFFVFAIWCMYSQPVPEDVAVRIVSGMSKSDVRLILGSPNVVYDEGKAEEWIYGSDFQWNFYCVDFSKDGKVIQAYFDD